MHVRELRCKFPIECIILGKFKVALYKNKLRQQLYNTLINCAYEYLI